MSKSRSQKVLDSRWVYLVFYFGAPVGVFSDVTLAAALYKKFFIEKGEPSEGDLYVCRYRPDIDFYKFQEYNVTSLIRKIVCNG